MRWTFKTALELGRVSNLPTVWSNTVAGVVLAGASPIDWRLAVLVIAMTLAYTGGMFLNDAFDAAVDKVERPERPIPAGLVSARSVTVAGFTLLLVSVSLISLIGFLGSGDGIKTLLSVCSLAGAIVLYNIWHKNNPFSPFIMGLCRMLIYTTAAFAITDSPSAMVYTGALVLLAYLIGLTYTAKQENLGEVKNLWPLLLLVVPLLFAVKTLATSADYPWFLAGVVLVFALWLGRSVQLVFRRHPGDIPKAVGTMIAGISLIDALFFVVSGYLMLAVLSMLCCLGTVLLQRWVAGT